MLVLVKCNDNKKVRSLHLLLSLPLGSIEVAHQQKKRNLHRIEKKALMETTLKPIMISYKRFVELDWGVDEGST